MQQELSVVLTHVVQVPAMEVQVHLGLSVRLWYPSAVFRHRYSEFVVESQSDPEKFPILCHLKNRLEPNYDLKCTHTIQQIPVVDLVVLITIVL